MSSAFMKPYPATIRRLQREAELTGLTVEMISYPYVAKHSYMAKYSGKPIYEFQIMRRGQLVKQSRSSHDISLWIAGFACAFSLCGGSH